MTWAQDIKIGYIGPMTGSRASIGEDAQAAAKLAIDEVNSKVSNAPNIKLVVEDSQGDPAKGIAAYKKLLSEDVHFVITQNSNISLPIAPLVTNDKVIQLAVTTTADRFSTPNDNTFRLNGGTLSEALAMSSFLEQRISEAESLAIVYMEDEYPVSLKGHLEQAVNNEQLKIAYQESYLPTENDYRSVITKLKSKGIRHIVFLGYQTQSGYFAKQARELQLAPKTLLFDIPANNREFFDIAKDAAKGTFCSYMVVNQNNEGSQAYHKTYGKQMTVFAANAYDAVKLAYRAYGKCEFKDDTDCLRKALFAIKNYDGASGLKGFDDKYGDMNDEIGILVGQDNEFVKAP